MQQIDVVAIVAATLPIACRSRSSFRLAAVASGEIIKKEDRQESAIRVAIIQYGHKC